MHEEIYQWLAQTKDGQMLREVTGASLKDVMKENGKGNLHYFMLEPKIAGPRPVAIKLGGKRKLIFWRRRVTHNDAEKKIKLNFTIHIVGWEENVKGVSVKSKMFIYPNGNIEFNNDETTLLGAYIEATKADLLKNL